MPSIRYNRDEGDKTSSVKAPSTSSLQDTSHPTALICVQGLDEAKDGGFVPLIARHGVYWPKSRVVYYSINRHSWKVIHDEGPNRDGNETKASVIGLHGDQVVLLDAVDPCLQRFDLVLREWTLHEVKGISTSPFSCVLCFMANIGSFIYWDRDRGDTMCVLDVVSCTWGERATKGELPVNLYGSPQSCYHGKSVYIVWAGMDRLTNLYIVANRYDKFYWSKPVVHGFQPSAVEETSLTYSAGRLFMFGGFRPLRSDSLAVYSIENAAWHEVCYGIGSEYTVDGEGIATASHSTVALHDKLIVFGGLSALFGSCRILEARQDAT